MNKKRIIIALALTATLSLGIVLSGCQTGGTTPTTSGTTAASSESKETSSKDKKDTTEEAKEKKSTEESKDKSTDSGSKDTLRNADFSGIISDLKDGEITAKELAITERDDGAMMVNMEGEERTIYYDENTTFENVDLGSMSAPKEEFTPTDESALKTDTMMYAWGKEVDGKFIADRIVLNSRNS